MIAQEWFLNSAGPCQFFFFQVSSDMIKCFQQKEGNTGCRSKKELRKESNMS